VRKSLGAGVAPECKAMLAAVLDEWQRWQPTKVV
jgi:hypothetical protein